MALCVLGEARGNYSIVPTVFVVHIILFKKVTTSLSFDDEIFLMREIFFEENNKIKSGVFFYFFILKQRFPRREV